MKILKQLTYTLTALFLMVVPVSAGQVELQTEVPLYEVKEGQELTEEEQRFLHATIDYFVENQEVESITVNSYDFPSIAYGNYQFVLDLNDKLDTFIAHFPIPCENEEYYTQDYLMYYSNYFYDYTGYTEITIVNRFSINPNYSFNSISPTPKEIYDWANYTCLLLQEIGIYNGMDDLQALNVINNFVCDLINYDDSNWNSYNYMNIYEFHKGLCADYSVILNTLAKCAGIESYYVRNDGHAWSRVIIDGTSLELDSCWNDFSSRTKYFLLTREQMAVYEYHETAEVLF